MKSFLNLCSLLIILHVPEILLAQDACELRKDHNGIRVYSCESATSVYNAVRAEFTLNASLDQYIATVLAVDEYEQWHFHSMNPRILKRISEREMIYYTQVSAPWPVSNRDVILRMKMEQDERTRELTVTLESLPDYLPDVKDIVRIPRSYSVMKLTPVGKSRLQVEFFIESDPGGEIPVWLVNSVSTQGPYETFTRLKNRLEKN